MPSDDFDLGAGPMAHQGRAVTADVIEQMHGKLNRSGFGGDSISCKDSSHGTSLLLPA
jgi:hypothetical protein